MHAVRQLYVPDGASCAAIALRPPRACAVHDLIPFNKAVVAINFITLFYYLFVQSVLAGREYWCAQMLH